MRERKEGSPSIEKKSLAEIKSLAVELKAKAEGAIAEAGGDMSNGKYEALFKNYESLESALNILAEVEVNEKNVGDANSAIEKFRGALPEKLRDGIFDLPMPGGEEKEADKKDKTDSEPSDEEKASADELREVNESLGDMEKYLHIIQESESVIDKIADTDELVRFAETKDNVLTKMKVFKDALKSKKILDFNLFDDLVNDYNELVKYYEELIDRKKPSHSEPPKTSVVSPDVDTWGSMPPDYVGSEPVGDKKKKTVDTKKTAKTDKDKKSEFDETEKYIEKIKQEAEQRMKNIQENKLVDPGITEIINQTYQNFLGTLGVYVERARLGNTDEKDDEAINQAIDNFFIELKTEEYKMLDFSKLNKKDKKSEDYLMLQRMIKQIEKVFDNFRKNKVIDDERLDTFHDKRNEFLKKIKIYAQKVIAGKASAKDKDVILKEANKFFLDLKFNIDTLPDIAEKKDSKGKKAAEPDMDDKDGVVAVRKTMQYGSLKATSAAPSGVSVGASSHPPTPDDDLDKVDGGTKKLKRAKVNPVVKIDDSEPIKEPIESIEEKKTKLGRAIWHSNKGKEEVVVTGHIEKAGKHYVTLKDKIIRARLEDVEFLPGDSVVEPKVDTEAVAASAGAEAEPVQDTEAKKLPEREKFLEIRAEAVKKVTRIQEALKRISDAYDHDIPHADLLPDFAERFKVDQLLITRFSKALKRFKDFFEIDKNGEKPAETLAIIKDIEAEFNEIDVLNTEVETLKQEAKDKYEEKQKELTEHYKEAADLVDALDAFGQFLISVEHHPLISYFDQTFVNQIKDVEKKLLTVRSQASDVEFMAKDLLGDLEKKKEYPQIDDETMVKVSLPKLQQERQEFDTQAETWKQTFEKEESKAIFLYEKFEIGRTAKSIDGFAEDQAMLNIFYKNICEHNPQFVWPREAERNAALANVKAGEQNRLMDETLDQEDKFLTEAKQKIELLSKPENRSIEAAEELVKSLDTISNIQSERMDVLPELLESFFDDALVERTERLNQFKDELSKFHLSGAAEEKYAKRLASIEVIIQALRDLKTSLSNLSFRDLHNNFGSPELLQKFFDRYFAGIKEFDSALADNFANLKDVEAKLIAKEKAEILANATATRAEKKKRKAPVSPPQDIPAGNIPMEHFALRRDVDTRKSIEKILKNVDVVDISPREIMKYFSDDDYEKMKKMAEMNDEEGFKEFLSEKIELSVGFFQTEDEARENIRRQVCEDVYAVLNKILNDQVESEIMKKDGSKKLAWLKKGSKALLNIGLSLGVGGVAASLTIGSGGGLVAAGVAGGTIALVKSIYKLFDSTEAVKALEEKVDSGASKFLKSVFRLKERSDAPEVTRRYWEDAVDEHITKEKISVLLSNAMRENTSEAWLANLPQLTESLSGRGAEAIPEEQYKKSLEILDNQGLGEFFKNSLNYVSVAPEYRSLSDADKVNIAATMALTIGQGYRGNIKAAEAFSEVQGQAEVKGKASWLAEKYFKLVSWKNGEEFSRRLKQHNENDGKNWEKAAGVAWSSLVGGAFAGVLRSSSLTARVMGGAVAGAGAGLGVEQSFRRSEQEKLESKVAEIINDTEKELLKIEDRPIDQLPMSRLKNLSKISADLQAQIDMGVIKDKITKSRIDGVVYRIRKVESEAAMRMERDFDRLGATLDLLVRNGEQIDNATNKKLNRLRKASKNKQPRYMIGGALLGAGLALGMSDLREWIGEPNTSDKEESEQEFAPRETITATEAPDAISVANYTPPKGGANAEYILDETLITAKAPGGAIAANPPSTLPSGGYYDSKLYTPVEADADTVAVAEATPATPEPTVTPEVKARLVANEDVTDKAPDEPLENEWDKAIREHPSQKELIQRFRNIAEEAKDPQSEEKLLASMRDFVGETPETPVGTPESSAQDKPELSWREAANQANWNKVISHYPELKSNLNFLEAAVKSSAIPGNLRADLSSSIDKIRDTYLASDEATHSDQVSSALKQITESARREIWNSMLDTATSAESRSDLKWLEERLQEAGTSGVRNEINADLRKIMTDYVKTGELDEKFLNKSVNHWKFMGPVIASR